MSDDVTPAAESLEARASAPASASAAEGAPATAGAMIRAARTAQGLDPAALAAMLKIPLRRIEALEQGRHEELQGATFERALAQAACRALRIDPKPVLDLLPQHEGNTLERVTEGLNTPFRERQGGGATLGEVSAVFRPVVVVPALLVLGAVALLAVPESFVARVMHPAPGAAASAAVRGAPAVSASEASAEAVPAPAEIPSAPAAPLRITAANAIPAPAAAPASVPAAAVPAVAAAAIPLQVAATADSWVEVRDARGRPLLARTVLAGESVGLDGAMPLRVKVGNARGTRLILRGDNVDLAPWTHDNVARLELK
jgi:cytoskeleton protein RodZ